MIPAWLHFVIPRPEISITWRCTFDLINLQASERDTWNHDETETDRTKKLQDEIKMLKDLINLKDQQMEQLKLENQELKMLCHVLLGSD